MTRHGGRIGELDALRGLAAVSVMLFHYSTYFQGKVGHVTPLGWELPVGNYGVNLFFLISGYVIFMTLERRPAPAQFAVARFSRLFPAYWACMLLTTAVVHVLGMPWQKVGGRDWLLNLTMFHEFLGAASVDGSYWTLEVELFFYVQMLVLAILGWLARIRWVIAGWLLLVLANALAVHHHVHVSYTLSQLLLLRHIPFFALGILFYRWHSLPSCVSRLPELALMAVTFGVIVLVLPRPFTWVALACCVVFALLVGGRLNWLRHPLTLWLGAISYPLYLLHQEIGYAIMRRLELGGIPPNLALAGTVASVLALATLVHLLVERPAMEAIRAWWAGRAAARPMPAGLDKGAQVGRR